LTETDTLTRGRKAIEEALAQPTLCAAFQVTARACADRPALRTFGEEGCVTWARYAERVEAIATGLAALGVKPGDVVCTMIRNRPEYHLIDTAVMHLGAAGCAMYLTNPAEKLVPLVRNADARVLVTEQDYLETIMEVADEVEHVEHVVLIEGTKTDQRQILLAELEQLEARGFDFEAAWRAVEAETIASLSHTSGTTGQPKGVQTSHRALMFNVRSLDRLCPPSPGGRFISYLPMAHMGERYMSHYSSLCFGYELHSLPDGQRIGEALRDIHPTRFFSVPRVWEKLAAAALDIVATDPAYQAALLVGRDRVRLAQQGRSLNGPDAERAESAIATLEPVRAAIGLDRAEYLGAGAAAPPLGVLETLHALGLPALECYGMSETALVLSNTPERFKLGTVGIPMPGVEAKIADDGELLIRAPALFTSYRHDPQATRETLDEDGWIHTGDVARIDDDGFYRIIDRKKEIIVTATGKNVAPLQLENLVTQGSLLVSQVVAIGEGRRHVAALIVMDPQVLAQRGLPTDLEEAARHPDVVSEVEQAISSANEHLSRAEQIRSWRILPVEWAPGGDELTTTGKLRRRNVSEKYAAEIAALYD
jgi:long-subunit acyl-CoA synthetase (AMP-forming)